MRVIAGTRRSMPLKSPQGMDTRPTQDRTKETLFNVLQNDISGAAFLDLYSGSGGIGIEALSRGARYAVMVDNSRTAMACIKDNLKFTRLEDEAQLMEMDVLSALERLKGHEEFDIIFMDPPYKSEADIQVMQALSRMNYVSDYTIIVIEAALKRDWSFLEDYGFELYKVKEYKTNQHVFIRKIQSTNR